MCTPAIHYGYDASLPLGDLHERGLGHVEVGPGRVAPPAVVRVLGPVWWAEVRGGHRGERRAPEAVGRADAPDLIAGSAGVAVVE